MIGKGSAVASVEHVNTQLQTHIQYTNCRVHVDTKPHARGYVRGYTLPVCSGSQDVSNLFL